MFLSSAIVCDRLRSRSQDRRRSQNCVSIWSLTIAELSAICDLRSAIIWKPAYSLRTYGTSVFPLSLYRNESSIGERTLYKTILLIRIFRKTVRQEHIQDTKSTTNQRVPPKNWTSVFMNRNSVFLLCLPISNWKFHRAAFLERLCSPVEPLEQIQCWNLAYRTEGWVGSVSEQNWTSVFIIQSNPVFKTQIGSVLPQN